MRAFRFSPSKVALGYIALSVLALALFALPLWFGFRANLGTFRAYVPGEEMQRLADVFQRDGASALARAIEAQVRSTPRDQVVLFAAPSKELLAGNLPAWPPEVPDAPGAYGLVISVGGRESMRVVASHVRLAGGYHLLMGRESVRFESLVERFWYGIAGAVAIVLALGAAFAWLLRRTLLSEVNEISRTASAIVQGDLSRRLPVGGGAGELDTLAQTVNGMLAQLARSQEGLEAQVAQRTAQLRDSEERYALAVAGANDGIWDWDLASGMIYISPRAQEIIMGRGSDGVDVRHADEWAQRYRLHPDDAPLREAALREHFRGRTPYYEGEWRVLHPDGTHHWVHSRGICTRDASGRAVRFAGSSTDIDARKRTEAALRRSEERYALAVQAAGEGHSDWNLETGEFYVSPRLLEICGYSPGTKFKDRAEWVARFPFHPDDRPKWEQAVAAHMAGRDLRFDMEVRVVVRGETRWVRFVFLCSRDPSGRPVRWTGSLVDITEPKLAADALRLSEERYARAMDAAETGHWEWNVATGEYFVSARQREMLELPPDLRFATRDQYLAHVPIHPDDRQPYIEASDRHIRTAVRRFEQEYRVVLKGGEVRWMRLRGKSTLDAQGRPTHFSGSLIDITERRLGGDALRESEERYERAMLAAEAGFWDWDVLADEYHVSPKFLEMGGFAPGTTFSSRADHMQRAPFHPADRDKWQRAVKELFAGTGRRLSMELRVIVNGQTRWQSLSGICVRDATGKVVRWTGSTTDVTERKRADEALRASEARFRSLTELSSDWYWEQDENLRFTYLSSQAQALTGYSGESSLGKTRGQIANMTPLSCTWAEHQAVLAARQPFRDFECRRVGPDGTVRYLSMSGAPVFDEQGRFKGYQGIGRNITERKRIEEELRSRQEMLDLAQKSARVTAFEWRIGANGEGQNRWSPELEAMYGLAPGSYDGTFETWKKLVHPEDWPAVKEAINHAQRTGDVASEYRVVHRDGSVHWLSARGRMFFDGEGKPARMVGFMHDVTERRQAEEELKRMERQLRQAQRLEAMGTLAGGIAHDFNNILGAILGYGEMALRDAAKGSRLRRDLDSIMAAGERGRALVDRVLAFSRSGVGERVAVHVEKVVREALDLLSAKLPPNVTLHAKLHAGRAAMQGDATQVHQVLMNLATNAIQAMPAGGTVRVSLDTARVDTARTPTIGVVNAGEYVVLAVADTGTGIAPEIVDKIFDPFFTTKEVGTGTGLGLSLVHGIVSELGGAIDVATTPGAGSTLTVYLPRSGDALNSLEKEEPELPRGEGQRVLIVDDEEPLVRLATRTLEELGYAPTGFTSSAAALAAFRADPQRFDALITDERMPGMSGSALIREVRGIRDRIPVVLMSGFVGGAVASSAREAGAEEILKKPLSARELATSLARVLHS